VVTQPWDWPSRGKHPVLLLLPKFMSWVGWKIELQEVLQFA
jgi:hypothetical protein